MKGIELLALGLRLVGVYGLLKGIQFIGIAYSSIQNLSFGLSDEDLSMWYAVFGVSIVGYFVASSVLVAFPSKVAKRLMPRTEPKEARVQIGQADVQSIAFTILGVYVLSCSVPELVHHLALAWHSVNLSEFYSPGAFGEYAIGSGVAFLKVGIGAYLCLQSQGLSRMLASIRGFGYN